MAFMPTMRAGKFDNSYMLHQYQMFEKAHHTIYLSFTGAQRRDDFHSLISMWAERYFIFHRTLSILCGSTVKTVTNHLS